MENYSLSHVPKVFVHESQFFNTQIIKYDFFKFHWKLLLVLLWAKDYCEQTKR